MRDSAALGIFRNKRQYAAFRDGQSGDERGSEGMTTTVALVLAGGRGLRAGGGMPKQYRTIAGEPLLRHTLRAFAEHPRVDAVRAVIHPDDLPLFQHAAESLDILPPVHGGETRQESGYNGLASLESLDPDFVLIQDAARPFTDRATIDRVIDALADTPAALAAMPVSDTIKRADADGRVSGTVDRESLWRAQTPQGFQYRTILDAHRELTGHGLTDDAALAEAAGLPVTLVQGSEDNIKVTTPDDFARAERIAGAAGGTIHVGFGYDVHRFEPGDHVILCGVTIPHTAKLRGHSDADAGLHAITDAILGALADGDIGDHFPPSDARWRNADSAMFLEAAAEKVRARGGAIQHIDATLICEKPRIGPHRDAMRARVAEICGIEPAQVGIKATTTEGLGFAGREEGIAAQAVATVRLP
jgi:2-C-methyl-D-erythritol 4-phosphate cytidylyltransferase/2-C-methyl-D-erythritol 2,4-cyclodiphosphate synthase